MDWSLCDSPTHSHVSFQQIGIFDTDTKNIYFCELNNEDCNCFEIYIVFSFWILSNIFWRMLCNLGNTSRYHSGSRIFELRFQVFDILGTAFSSKFKLIFKTECLSWILCGLSNIVWNNIFNVFSNHESYPVNPLLFVPFWSFLTST